MPLLTDKFGPTSSNLTNQFSVHFPREERIAKLKWFWAFLLNFHKGNLWLILGLASEIGGESQRAFADVGGKSCHHLNTSMFKPKLHRTNHLCDSSINTKHAQVKVPLYDGHVPKSTSIIKDAAGMAQIFFHETECFVLAF